MIVTCTAIGTAASIAIAAYHMAQGKLSYGSLLIILFLAGECMKPLNDMNTYWHSSYLGLSVAEELFAVLDEPVALKDGKGPNQLTGELPEISMNQVFFHYDKSSADVLENIDLQFDSGKITAIVGKSGSGKSTIVNLLLRFMMFPPAVLFWTEWIFGIFPSSFCAAKLRWCSRNPICFMERSEKISRWQIQKPPMRR